MKLDQIINLKKPIKWLFYGDSITQGSLHTFGHRSYPELFSERVRYELNRPMDIVINTAFSGHTSKDLIVSFDRRVADLKPDIVFIMVGMNDCNKSKGINIQQFEKNVVKILLLVESIGASSILQTTCPTLLGEPDYESYSSLGSYMDVIRKLAKENDLPLIDHMSFWRENFEFHAQWMNNLVHPNYIGHRAFAKCLFQSFDIYDDAAPSCKLALK